MINSEINKNQDDNIRRLNFSLPMNTPNGLVHTFILRVTSNDMKLEINSKKKTGKFTNMWRLKAYS